MEFPLLIAGLGLIGLSSFRAFVPAFAAALLMRFGPELGLTEGILGMLTPDDAPTWFTSNPSLVILGLLAGLEIAATKNADARAIYGWVDQYAKPIMAGLTQLGILSAADARFIHSATPAALAGQSAHAAVPAGIGWEAVTVPATILGTWAMAAMRQQLMQWVTDFDEDDDIGLQGWWSWAEDIWALVGLWFLLLFPLVMLVLIGVVCGLVWWLRRRAAKKDEQSKIACLSPNCDAQVYACAVACQTCQTPVAEPRGLTWLGGAAMDKPADTAKLPHQLAAQKRCPVCATRLEKHTANQTCPACGHAVFGDPAFTQAYVDRITARLPVSLLICAGFSAIPIVGLIPGVIYYRLRLVAPFARYVPRGRHLLAKWSIRLLFVLLIAFQWVPGAGALTVPAMALVGFLTYRALFQHAATGGRVAND